MPLGHSEGSASFSGAAVEAVGGLRDYDGLSAADQAAVREVWDRRIAVRRASLNYEERFRQESRTQWSDADELGNLILRGEGG